MIEHVNAGEVDRQVGGPGVKLGRTINEIIDALKDAHSEILELRTRLEVLEAAEEEYDEE